MEKLGKADSSTNYALNNLAKIYLRMGEYEKSMTILKVYC